MKACKHLDHDETKYPGCTLKEIEGFDCPVKYFERSEVWTHENGKQVNPRDVQFCEKGKGRINGIFQCYNEGEMPCYEAEEVNND